MTRPLPKSRLSAKRRTVILADAMYDTEGLRRAGIGRLLLMEMRKGGAVRPLTIGCKQWYLGREIISWAEKSQADKKQKAG